jgi:hypothetical protein
MPSLDDQLRGYARHLDSVPPVTADEARQRAIEPPIYGSTAREVFVTPSPRDRRHLLSLVAAVVGLALLAVFVKSSATPTTTLTDRYYLPSWVPDGMRLADKRAVAADPVSPTATLVRIDRPGVITVVVDGPATPAATDFMDPVAVGDRPGEIVSAPYEWTHVDWSDGTHDYSVSGTGAADAELVQTAASVRVDDDGNARRLELRAPAGWERLNVSRPADPSVTLTYIADDLRTMTVSVYAGAAALVDDLRASLPNGEPLNDGRVRGVAVTRGEWTIADLALPSGQFVEITSRAVPLSDVARLGAAIRSVDGNTWVGARVEAGAMVTYQPANLLLPFPARGGVVAGAEPGPNGSWCFRIMPTPTLFVRTCAIGSRPIFVSELGASAGIGSSSGRAAFGFTDATTAYVAIELEDGSIVEADLGHVDAADRCIWSASLPFDSTIRAIRAQDASGKALWQVGRPWRSS